MSNERGMRNFQIREISKNGIFKGDSLFTKKRQHGT